MNNDKRRRFDWSTVLMLIALIVLMTSGYYVSRKKIRIKEAASLPFYEIDMSQIADGEYEGKTYTSFLHLQLKVIVENHKLKDIQVIENKGYDADTALPILKNMIEENSVIVPAIKGSEIGSLVYISCVSTALKDEQ